jgi:hypothetical protein
MGNELLQLFKAADLAHTEIVKLQAQARAIVRAAQPLRGGRSRPAARLTKRGRSQHIDRRPLQNSRLWHFELWNVCGKTLN